MLAAHEPTQNHLLAALPAADYQRLHAQLELVSLPLGLALYESGTPQGYVYLPITGAAGKLQAGGVIHYSRGRITVLDRGQLEARVCECYGVVKRESDRLLSPMVEEVS